MLKLLLISAWFLFHPVHVSITSLDYVPEKDLFKVFVRMYFDDFLLDYKLNNKTVSDADFSGNNPGTIELLQKYLSEKVIIKVNDRQLSGIINKYQNVDNEISMDLEFKAFRDPESITVKNLIMTGLYNDQLNMMIIRVNGFEQGIKLTSDQSEQTLNVK
jgi:hypothetical protein